MFWRKTSLKILTQIEQTNVCQLHLRFAKLYEKIPQNGKQQLPFQDKTR